jgi:hypothetical protein
MSSKKIVARVAASPSPERNTIYSGVFSTTLPRITVPFFKITTSARTAAAMLKTKAAAKTIPIT